jgi:hypothetical protein
MKNIFRIIGVSLASMAGVLLVGGVAWAQATQTPVWGQVVSSRVTDPGEHWVDDDGGHWRNIRRTVRFTGEITGRMFLVNNANQVLPDGETQTHGVFSFVGEVPGGLVTARGTQKSKCTQIVGGVFCETRRVWRLSDRGLIKTTSSVVIGNLPFDYEGTIYDNPGGN